MKDFIVSLLDKLLEQNIYFVGSIGLGALLFFLVLAIIILILTLKNCKTFGKIMHSVFLLITIPEAIYVAYWLMIFVQMQTGNLTKFPI